MLTQTPTVEDYESLATLASMVKPSKSNPSHALLSLQALIQFISDTDIFTFLFTDELPFPHIAMPDLFSRSLTGTFTKTRVEPGNSSNHSLSLHASGSYLLIPAFTVKHITYGSGLHIFTYPSSSHSNSSPPSIQVVEARFVRNESKGIFLKVLDWDRSGFITLEFSQMTSTTQIVRSAATFYRDRFRQLLNLGTLDMPLVLSCLSEFHTAKQYRLCPNCSHTHHSCMCKIPIVQPRHPLDPMAFLKNMTTWFGKFEGICHVTSYMNGTNKRRALLGCRYTVDGQKNPDKMELMRSLIVQKHITQTSAPHFFMPSNLTRHNSHSTTNEQTNAAGDILSELKSKVSEKNRSFSRSCEIKDMAVTRGEDTSYSGDHCLLNQEALVPSAMDLHILFSPNADQAQQGQEQTEFQYFSPVISDMTSVSLSSPVTPQRRQHGTKGQDEQIRLHKLERRKARNRASAMRSHLKKKAFIDGLKEELERNQRKILNLRSKEMCLRKQNLQLRGVLR